MAAIGATHGGAHAESAFGEVQAIADGAADTVEGNPADVPQVDSTLQHEIFDQAADGIVGQRGDNGGLQAKAATKAARDIVFAATFPDAKLPRGGDG